MVTAKKESTEVAQVSSVSTTFGSMFTTARDDNSFDVKVMLLKVENAFDTKKDGSQRNAKSADTVLSIKDSAGKLLRPFCYRSSVFGQGIPALPGSGLPVVCTFIPQEGINPITKVAYDPKLIGLRVDIEAIQEEVMRKLNSLKGSLVATM